MRTRVALHLLAQDARRRADAAEKLAEKEGRTAKAAGLLLEALAFQRAAAKVDELAEGTET